MSLDLLRLFFLIPDPDWRIRSSTVLFIPSGTRLLADSFNVRPSSTSFASSVPVLKAFASIRVLRVVINGSTSRRKNPPEILPLCTFRPAKTGISPWFCRQLYSSYKHGSYGQGKSRKVRGSGKVRDFKIASVQKFLINRYLI